MGASLPGQVRPDLAGFRERVRSGTGNVVPVVWEGVADLETPISLFCKLRPLGACYLLESAEQGGRLGRYSFIGFAPFARLEADSRGVRVCGQGVAAAAGRGACERLGANPLRALADLLAHHRPACRPDVTEVPPFWGGAVGFFGWELVHHLERIPRLPDDGSGWPEAAFFLTERVVVVDHFRHRLLGVCSALLPPGADADGASAQAAYARAVDALAEVQAAIAGPAPHLPPVALPVSGPPPVPSPQARVPEAVGAASHMTRAQHAAMVACAKEYIRQGDIFQVVLGQRFTRPFAGDPLQVYRVLRSLNPSPYMFYLDFGDGQLVGASPELLVRVQDGVVETRPIAGSRPRSADPARDAALEAELRADPKELAEHVMLVDLGRNDIGRVAVPGTVEVPEQLVVERFSHVMHLVSSVRGRLRPEHDAFSALAACFPAGTLSGAPKVRAMEIISELEPHRRGPYGGCVAYFGFDGNMDTAICIRTVAIRGGLACVQAGGGIVADSVPEREYEECVNKASAVLRALEAAEGAAVGPGARSSRPPAGAPLPGGGVK